MRPRPMLLIAAAVLAVVHVIGVLFARPLWRPAELVAALCLLAYPIGARSWLVTAAVGVLVAGAALTVPEPGGDAGMQVLSPEEYAGLFRQDQLESLARVTATLLFVLLLLAVLRRPAGRTRPGRAMLAAAAAASLIIIGYAVVRSVVILSTGPHPTSLGVGAVLPLLLALAALALAVAAAANRRWRAAAGAVLFVAVAVIFLDAALGAVALPYEARDYAQLFALDLITATDAVPQPTLALTVALQLTAAILAVADLTARR